MSTKKITKSDIFSERIKTVRGQRSKAEFARVLLISPQNYQRYEDGRIPDADILDRIASQCNVTVDWLLGRDAPTVVSGMAVVDQAAFIEDVQTVTGQQRERMKKKADGIIHCMPTVPKALREKLREDLNKAFDKYMEWCEVNYENTTVTQGGEEKKQNS